MSRFAEVRNCEAIPLADIPCTDVDGWRAAIVQALDEGRRIAALFATGGGSAPLELVAVLADDSEGLLLVGRATLTGDAYPALTPLCPEAHWFEREMAEQYGLRPQGHPWCKPLRFHPSWRPGHDAWDRPAGTVPVVGVTDYFRVQGEEVHEVAVGPVHAGVIEPGHFRFQCHGEEVFHLEISLGYQHRGIEEALFGGPHLRTLYQMEALAGDTTVGHTTAYCQVLEALAGCTPPARAQVLRGVGLELERLANHTGDLGALANDVGYLPTASFCGRIRGDFLNLTALLCGSRFGRGLIRPGGTGFDLDDAQVPELRARLAQAGRDLKGAAELLWSSATVVARFQHTGRVERAVCEQLGLVGPAARASGADRDVRRDFPQGIYQYTHLPVMTAEDGDVNARALVRWLEAQQSLEFVEERLAAMPVAAAKSSARSPLGALAPEHLVVSLVEGWRGELCHVAITDSGGQFARYKVVDPSFHNWFGLAMALRGEQISDFPLCNKSFNLSYCGHDL